MAKYQVVLTNLKLPDGGISIDEHPVMFDAEGHRESVDGQGRAVVEFLDADGNVTEGWFKEQVVSVGRLEE